MRRLHHRCCWIGGIRRRRSWTGLLSDGCRTRHEKTSKRACKHTFHVRDRPGRNGFRTTRSTYARGPSKASTIHKHDPKVVRNTGAGGRPRSPIKSPPGCPIFATVTSSLRWAWHENTQTAPSTLTGNPAPPQSSTPPPPSAAPAATAPPTPASLHPPPTPPPSAPSVSAPLLTRNPTQAGGPGLKSTHNPGAPSSAQSHRG